MPRSSKKGTDYDRSSYKKYDPEKYELILSMRKQGKSYNEITSVTGASPNTISRICYENAEELGKWKKRVSSKLGEAIDLLSDRLITEADKLSIGQVPVSIAIAADKKAMLDNENVTHVVHHKGLNHSDLASKLNEMKKASRAGDVIDVPSEEPPTDSK
tara:strand:- start:3253 stop:3729 length:477 start_codon:yes stop_codon:yes gene_type:complete